MKRLVLLFLVACSGSTQLPKGPPPEYEEEPGPSQVDAAPQPAADAGDVG